MPSRVTDAVAKPEAVAEDVAPASIAYKRYMLGLLLTTLAFNYVDRLAFGLVAQDIKIELGLSDTALGLLSGLAFAIFYSVMGIPIARWADRGSRVTIITVTTALWSAAVALCGLVTSFAQLVAIRVGVAVGEAGCIPPAHSLIADYFTRSERPRAVGVYMLGKPLSMVIGYFVAGWVNQLYGWRTTFIVLGIPGVILALLARFTLREPRRETSKSIVSGMKQGGQANLLATIVVLWRNRTFRCLLLCFAVSTFFNYGIGQWQPVFFIRSYGMTTGTLGTVFALIWGLGGLAGTYLGGVLASKFAPDDERLQLKAAALAFSLFAIVSVGIYAAPSTYPAFGCMAVAAVGGYLINGPLFATIQTLVPQEMRALSIAFIYLVANLVGMGLGPLAAGVLSDALRTWAGAESLRYALLLLCPGYLLCTAFLWRASRTVAADLAAARS